MTWLWSLLIALIVIVVSMMLHELAHGLVAYRLGDDTAKMEGRLTLNPLKHLDPLLSIVMPLILFLSGGLIFGGAKPVPIDTRNLKYGAWGMALVAIAGPLTNLILALIAFLIGSLTGWLLDTGFWGLFWSYVVYINLGFGVFNLIPIPPLDGSRVLYAIAPDGIRVVMAQIERWGILIILLLVIIMPGLLSSIMGTAMEAILQFYSLIARGVGGIFGI